MPVKLSTLKLSLGVMSALGLDPGVKGNDEIILECKRESPECKVDGKMQPRRNRGVQVKGSRGLFGAEVFTQAGTPLTLRFSLKPRTAPAPTEEDETIL